MLDSIIVHNRMVVAYSMLLACLLNRHCDSSTNTLPLSLPNIWGRCEWLGRPWWVHRRVSPRAFLGRRGWLEHFTALAQEFHFSYQARKQNVMCIQVALNVAPSQLSPQRPHISTIPPFAHDPRPTTVSMHLHFWITIQTVGLLSDLCEWWIKRVL